MKTWRLFFVLLFVNPMAFATVIYGVSQIEKKHQHTKYPTYVQMGSFSNISTAQHFQSRLYATNIQTVIQPSNNRYTVLAGPFYNEKTLISFAKKMSDNVLSSSPKTERSPNIFSLPPTLSQSQYPQTPRTISKKMPPQNGPRSEKKLKFRTILPSDVHPEISAFFGETYIPNTIGGQTLQLMPYEIGPYADTFTGQSDASSFSWGLSALYRFNLNETTGQNRFFESFAAGIAIYQITSFNQTGTVLQFGMPEFQNYNYNLGLNNFRILADFDVALHPIKEVFTPFIEVGIGTAQTTVSYDSSPILPVESPVFTLENETSWNFAYQIGPGIRYLITPNLQLSLRYLYAHMGTANSSMMGSSTILGAPLKVGTGTHNFLFGLTYLIA